MSSGGYERTALCALVTSAALSLTMSIDAEMVCAWHFNELVGSEVALVADHGEGLLEMSSIEGAVDVYDGTELNALAGDPAGFALGVRGAAANGSWIELRFAPDVAAEFSFAYRRTATGFDENLVQSWDGMEWKTLAEFGGSASFTPLGIEWERVAISIPGTGGDARLRVVIDGADGANGTIRFDNVQVASVPAPGAWLLGGIGGLVSLHGRERRRCHC